mmetsp:Transcript_44008/g.80425  ORF Transcript_44008/g.80425 Transcript_44008/m.80425 type:complete len:214 (-) Transcript_44008:38-679(-)
MGVRSVLALTLTVFCTTCHAVRLRSQRTSGYDAEDARLSESQATEAYEQLNYAVELLNSTAQAVPKAGHLSANSTAKLKQQQDSLESLLGHLKANIAGFNKHEIEAKETNERKVKELEERLAEDKAALKRTNISAFDHELLTNRTRTEEQELSYWKRGREISHNMFHSNLKVTHGLMSKVRSIMDAYKSVLTTGRLDAKTAEALRSASAGLKN